VSIEEVNRVHQRRLYESTKGLMTGAEQLINPRKRGADERFLFHGK
jgi:hypothetical protein